MSITKGVDNQPATASSPAESGTSATAFQKNTLAPEVEVSQFVSGEAVRSRQNEENGSRRRDRQWSRSGKKGTSPFEEKLTRAEDGESAVKGLEGRKPRYPKKSEEGWQNFFASILSLGKREKKVSRKAQDLKNSSFRGLVSRMKGEAGPVVVADLNFKSEHQAGAEKFVRIPLAVDAAGSLAGLEPGDLLETSLLQMLGDEIHYLRLESHVQAGSTVGAQTLLTHLRQKGSASLASRMESSLQQERSRREKMTQLDLPQVDKQAASTDLKLKTPDIFRWMVMGGVLITVVLFIVFKMAR